MTAADMFPGKDRAQRRLAEELIIWMTTVTSAGRPQTSPVWFTIEDDEFLVYSKESARVRNIEANPRVALNLDGNGAGGDIVTIEGTATVDRSVRPAYENEAFVAKYKPRIDLYGWTPESFAADYPVPIRISFDRGRAW